jgi:hypothetical protein
VAARTFLESFIAWQYSHTLLSLMLLDLSVLLSPISISYSRLTLHTITLCSHSLFPKSSVTSLP